MEHVLGQKVLCGYVLDGEGNFTFHVLASDLLPLVDIRKVVYTGPCLPVLLSF